jgi:nucleoside-diphosphate-sugar epimerase
VNIIVTGGLGHIGSYIVPRLAKDNNVTVVDNLSTERYCSLFNLVNKISFKNINFRDISDIMLKEADVIIHLAAVVNAEKSFADKVAVKQCNVYDTIEFFKRVQMYNTSIFFPSSTSVYGSNIDVMYEDSELNPQSPYAEAKIAVEEYLEWNNENHIIARLGTIYGVSPGMRFQTAVNKFCFQQSMGQPITLWRENVNMVRPYLGLADLYSAIQVLLMEQTGTYNVISGNHVTIDIANYISTNIVWVDSPLLNQHSYKVSIDKILQTGYYPGCCVFDGIDDTLLLLRNLK